MRLCTLVTYCLLLVGFNAPALADDRLVRLAVPPELAESGLMDYMLPRFSLKTQVRVELVAPGDPAEAEIGDSGTPVFSGDGATWSLLVAMPDHPGAAKFADWLTSPTGQAAITGFARDGQQVFGLPAAEAVAIVEVAFEGDAVEGRRLSRVHCGRCHVSDANTMGGIGSTPSFFVLRALEDWDTRFQSFYVLNPHPSFTQIKDVTRPFPSTRPPPIVPLEMTLDDLEAILAYVAALEPADLGAPIEHQ